MLESSTAEMLALNIKNKLDAVSPKSEHMPSKKEEEYYKVDRSKNTYYQTIQLLKQALHMNTL